MIYNDNLTLICITPEQHSRTCGYWYLIHKGAMSHTAFRTKQGLDRWLKERGLLLLDAIPGTKGAHKVIKIKGGYYDNMTYEALPDGVATKELSNGSYTLATITERDGSRVINYHNPNVKNRLEFEYFSSAKEMM